MTTRRAWWRALALLGCLLSVAAGAPGTAASQAGAPATDGGISRGVVVLPDTVTIGDPFRVVVRVRAPRGATIDFPQLPDSGTGVEALDPVDVVASADTTANEQTATYRLAAWDVGARAIRFPDILVRDGASERRVAVGRRLSIFVASVLPADSAARVPKPPRPLFEFGPPWWWWALVALAALGVGGALWWLWRRRRVVPVVPLRTPREQAEEEFTRIEALALVASGERGQHAALMADVLRDYLARVIPVALPSLTTSELLGRVRGDGRVPLARLARLLQAVDLVKFAGAGIDAERAVAAGSECRALVGLVDGAIEQERAVARASETKAAA